MPTTRGPPSGTNAFTINPNSTQLAFRLDPLAQLSTRWQRWNRFSPSKPIARRAELTFYLGRGWLPPQAPARIGRRARRKVAPTELGPASSWSVGTHRSPPFERLGDKRPYTFRSRMAKVELWGIG
jgi:hypothetical protein